MNWRTRLFGPAPADRADQRPSAYLATRSGITRVAVQLDSMQPFTDDAGKTDERLTSRVVYLAWTKSGRPVALAKNEHETGIQPADLATWDPAAMTGEIVKDGEPRGGVMLAPETPGKLAAERDDTEPAPVAETPGKLTPRQDG